MSYITNFEVWLFIFSSVVQVFDQCSSMSITFTNKGLPNAFSILLCVAKFEKSAPLQFLSRCLFSSSTEAYLMKNYGSMISLVCLSQK